MARFAYFDPTAPQPSPVLGLYDTDEISYPALPPTEARVPMTDEQWAAATREGGNWAVESGNIVRLTPPPFSPPPRTPATIEDLQARLDDIGREIAALKGADDNGHSQRGK